MGHLHHLKNVSITIMEKRNPKSLTKPPTPPLLSDNLSVSEDRVWSAGCPCLQLHHSSIMEGCVTNERRSTPLFIHHCLPHHPSFPQSFHSSVLPCLCLVWSTMWRERRACQCYQHATDDSFEGDRDFRLLPQWLITQTPLRVDPLWSLCKTNCWAMGGHFACLAFSFFFETLLMLDIIKCRESH